MKNQNSARTSNTGKAGRASHSGAQGSRTHGARHTRLYRFIAIFSFTFFVLNLLFVSISTATMQRQWSATGNQAGSVSYTTSFSDGNQKSTQIIPAANGAYITVWAENHYYDTTDPDPHYGYFYAQKTDKNGAAVWSGKVQVGRVTLAAPNTAMPHLLVASDGSNGAYIFWNTPTQAIYATRLNLDGTVNTTWGSGGSLGTVVMDYDVTPVEQNLELLSLIPDGGGGVIYSFYFQYDYLSHYVDRISVQRRDSSGNYYYAPRFETPGPTPYTGAAIAFDTSTGGFITLSSDLNKAPYQDMDLVDGSYLMIASHYYQTGSKVIVEKMDFGNGAAQFDSTNYTGKIVATSTDYANQVQLIRNGSGGAYITWLDNPRIELAKIDTNGDLVGTSCPAHPLDPLGDINDHTRAPVIAYDNNGGIFIAYTTSTSSANGDVKLVKATSCDSGDISTATINHPSSANKQAFVRLAGDNSTGTYILWEKQNSSTQDIMMQHANNDLTTTFGAGGLVDYTVISGLSGNNLGDEKEDVLSIQPMSFNIGNAGAAGVAVAFQDLQSNQIPKAHFDNFIYRLDDSDVAGNGDETPPWTPASAPVLPQTSHTFNYNDKSQQMTKLADGGIAMTWNASYYYDGQYYSEMHLQKIDSSGNLVWNSGNVAGIKGPATNGTNPSTSVMSNMVPSGDDLIVAIASPNYSNTGNNLTFFKISSTTPLPPTWMYSINIAEFDPMYPKLISDGSDGAYLLWHERQNDAYHLPTKDKSWNLFATHITSAGTVAADWNTGGSGTYRPLAIGSDPRDYCKSNIVPYTGGFYVTVETDDSPSTWDNCMNDATSFDLYAFKVNSTGTIQWSGAEKMISNIYNHSTGAKLNEYNHQTVVDSSGVMSITFMVEYSDATRHLMFQRLDSDGNLLFDYANPPYTNNPSEDPPLYHTAYPIDTIYGESGGDALNNASLIGTGTGESDTIVVYNKPGYTISDVGIAAGPGSGGVPDISFSNSVTASGSAAMLHENIAHGSFLQSPYGSTIMHDAGNGAIVAYASFTLAPNHLWIHAQDISGTTGAPLWSDSETLAHTGYFDFTTDPANIGFPILIPGSTIISWQKYNTSTTENDLIIQKMDEGTGGGGGCGPSGTEQCATQQIDCGTLTLHVDTNPDFTFTALSASTATQQSYGYTIGAGPDGNYQNGTNALPANAFIYIDDTRSVGPGCSTNGSTEGFDLNVSATNFTNGTSGTIPKANMRVVTTTNAATRGSVSWQEFGTNGQTDNYWANSNFTNPNNITLPYNVSNLDSLTDWTIFTSHGASLGGAGATIIDNSSGSGNNDNVVGQIGTGVAYNLEVPQNQQAGTYAGTITYDLVPAT